MGRLFGIVLLTVQGVCSCLANVTILVQASPTVAGSAAAGGNAVIVDYDNVTDWSNGLAACPPLTASLGDVVHCFVGLINSSSSNVLPSSMLTFVGKKESDILGQLAVQYDIQAFSSIEELLNVEVFTATKSCLLADLGFQFGVGGIAILYTVEYKTVTAQIQECLQDYYYINKSYKSYLFAMKNDLWSIERAVVQLKTTGFQSFVVLCPPSCIWKIFDVANRLSMTDMRYAWILSEPHQPLNDNFPLNVIAATTNKHDNNITTLEDAAKLRTMLGKIMETLNSSDKDSVLIANGSFTSSSSTQSRIDMRGGRKKRYVSVDSLNNSDVREFLRNRHRNLMIQTLIAEQWITVGEWRANKVAYYFTTSNFMTTFPRNSWKHRVRIVTILDPPFTMLLDRDTFDNSSKTCHPGHMCLHAEENDTWTNRCCIGFIVDLLELIKKNQEWSVQLYIVKDSTYGSYLPEEDRWTGLVGDVLYDKADVVMAALTITEKRAKVIDYTAPFMIGGIAMVTMAEKKELQFINWDFLQPLTWKLWTVTMGLLTTLSLAFVATEMFCGPQAKSYTFKESLTYLAGLAFQRDIGGKNPQQLATRTVAITTAMAMLIIMSTYTAVLTANKVSSNVKLPVTGFQDDKIRKPDSRFTFGTINNSAFTEMFRSSLDPAWNDMYRFMLPYNFVETSVAIGKLKQGKLGAIIHDYPVLFHYVAKEKDCSIKFAGSSIPDGGLGFAMKKNSPLQATLSVVIQGYKEDGVMSRLRDKWLSSSCANNAANDQANAVQLRIINFGGLVIITIGLIGFSIALLLFEIIIYRITTRNASTASKQTPNV